MVMTTAVLRLATPQKGNTHRQTDRERLGGPGGNDDSSVKTGLTTEGEHTQTGREGDVRCRQHLQSAQVFYMPA